MAAPLKRWFSNLSVNSSRRASRKAENCETQSVQTTSNEPQETSSDKRTSSTGNAPESSAVECPAREIVKKCDASTDTADHARDFITKTVSSPARLVRDNYEKTDSTSSCPVTTRPTEPAPAVLAVAPQEESVLPDPPQEKTDSRSSSEDERVPCIISEEKTVSHVPSQDKAPCPVTAGSPSLSKEKTALTFPCQEKAVRIEVCPLKEFLLGTVRAQEKAFLTAPCQGGSALAVPSHAKTASLIPSQEQTMLTAPLQEKTVSTVPCPVTAVLADPSKEKAVLIAPSQEKTMLTSPLPEKTVSTVPCPVTAVLAVPSKEKAILTAPSQEKSVLSVPSEQKNVLPGSSQEKTVSTVPSPVTTVLSKTSHEKDNLAIASSEKTILAISSQENTTLGSKLTAVFVASQEQLAPSIGNLQTSTLAISSREKMVITISSQEETAPLLSPQKMPSSISAPLKHSISVSSQTEPTVCHREQRTPSTFFPEETFAEKAPSSVHPTGKMDTGSAVASQYKIHSIVPSPKKSEPFTSPTGFTDTSMNQHSLENPNIFQEEKDDSALLSERVNSHLSHNIESWASRSEKIITSESPSVKRDHAAFYPVEADYHLIKATEPSLPYIEDAAVRAASSAGHPSVGCPVVSAAPSIGRPAVSTARSAGLTAISATHSVNRDHATFYPVEADYPLIQVTEPSTAYVEDAAFRAASSAGHTAVSAAPSTGRPAVIAAPSAGRSTIDAAPSAGRSAIGVAYSAGHAAVRASPSAGRPALSGTPSAGYTAISPAPSVGRTALSASPSAGHTAISPAPSVGRTALSASPSAGHPALSRAPSGGYTAISPAPSVGRTALSASPSAGHPALSRAPSGGYTAISPAPSVGRTALSASPSAGRPPLSGAPSAGYTVVSPAPSVGRTALSAAPSAGRRALSGAPSAGSIAISRAPSAGRPTLSGAPPAGYTAVREPSSAGHVSAASPISASPNIPLSGDNEASACPVCHSKYSSPKIPHPSCSCAFTCFPLNYTNPIAFPALHPNCTFSPPKNTSSSTPYAENSFTLKMQAPAHSVCPEDGPTSASASAFSPAKVVTPSSSLGFTCPISASLKQTSLPDSYPMKSEVSASQHNLCTPTNLDHQTTCPYYSSSEKTFTSSGKTGPSASSNDYACHCRIFPMSECQSSITAQNIDCPPSHTRNTAPPAHPTVSASPRCASSKSPYSVTLLSLELNSVPSLLGGPDPRKVCTKKSTSHTCTSKNTETSYSSSSLPRSIPNRTTNISPTASTAGNISPGKYSIKITDLSASSQICIAPQEMDSTNTSPSTFPRNPDPSVPSECYTSPGAASSQNICPPFSSTSCASPNRSRTTLPPAVSGTSDHSLSSECSHSLSASPKNVFPCPALGNVHPFAYSKENTDLFASAAGYSPSSESPIANSSLGNNSCCVAPKNTSPSVRPSKMDAINTCPSVSSSIGNLSRSPSPNSPFQYSHSPRTTCSCDDPSSNMYPVASSTRNHNLSVSPKSGSPRSSFSKQTNLSDTCPSKPLPINYSKRNGPHSSSQECPYVHSPRKAYDHDTSSCSVSPTDFSDRTPKSNQCAVHDRKHSSLDHSPSNTCPSFFSSGNHPGSVSPKNICSSVVSPEDISPREAGPIKSCLSTSSSLNRRRSVSFKITCPHGPSPCKICSPERSPGRATRNTHSSDSFSGNGFPSSDAARCSPRNSSFLDITFNDSGPTTNSSPDFDSPLFNSRRDCHSPYLYRS